MCKRMGGSFAASVPFDYFENIFINGTKTEENANTVLYGEHRQIADCSFSCSQQPDR